MKKEVISLFLTIFTLSHIVHADLYTETLPKAKPSSQTPSETGLQSGRYQLRHRGSEDVIYPEQKKKKNKTSEYSFIKKKPASEAAPIPVTVEESNASNEENTKLLDISLKDQVSDILSGGRKKIAEAYREQVHPDDIRMNKIEIDIGSGVDYNYSTANLAYRKYYTFAPNLNLGAHIWLTPLFGLSGFYKATYGEDVTVTTNALNRIPVKSEWIELSLDFRKFYGFSRRSNNLQYGVLYSENKFSPPADDGSRIRLKSSGLGVYVKSRFPVAPSYSWTLGGEVLPLVSHTELQTALQLRSGSTVASSRIGINFGGEFKLDRQNQLVWLLGFKLERNQFDGSANMTDPETGTTPSGVSVSNTWTYFQLVYRWGH